MLSVTVGMMMSVIVSTVMMPVIIMPVPIIPFTVAVKIFPMASVAIISFIIMPVGMSAKFRVLAFPVMRKRYTGAHKQQSSRQYDNFFDFCLHRFPPLEFEGLTC
jgi:hypothetical protein